MIDGKFAGDKPTTSLGGTHALCLLRAAERKFAGAGRCCLGMQHPASICNFCFYPESDISGASRRATSITREEAFLIAVNIVKLPSVPRQILKDIPRPPNSASRDD